MGHPNTSVKVWIEEKKLFHWLQPSFKLFHPLNSAFDKIQYASLFKLKTALDNGNRNGKYVAVLKLHDKWDECIKTDDYILNIP